MPRYRQATLFACSALLAFACATASGCDAALHEGRADMPDVFEVRDKSAPNETVKPDSGTPVTPLAAPRPHAASVTSAYDLTAILSLDPRDIPDTVERVGFAYELGAPTGSWERVGDQLPLSPDGARSRILFSLNGGETTAELMRCGHSPDVVGLHITAPYTEDDEAQAVGASLLDAAGLGDEQYANNTVDEQLLQTSSVRIGRCPEGSEATVWKLWIWSQSDERWAQTTYYLGVYTDEGAQALQDDDMQAALAAMREV